MSDQSLGSPEGAREPSWPQEPGHQAPGQDSTGAGQGAGPEQSFGHPQSEPERQSEPGHLADSRPAAGGGEAAGGNPPELKIPQPPLVPPTRGSDEAASAGASAVNSSGSAGTDTAVTQSMPAPQDPGYPRETSDRGHPQGAAFGVPLGGTAGTPGSTLGQGSYQGPYQGPQPVRKQSVKRFSTGTLVGSVVAAALLAGSVAAGGVTILNNLNGGPVTGQQSANSPVIVNNTDSVNAVTAAAQKASPSVVTLAVSGGSGSGSGSGIILDGNGNILTNNHVVTLDGKVANPSIQVRLNDGRVFNASVVGSDPLNDLAVINIQADNLTPAQLGDSSKLNVGDNVIAIGTPLQLSLSNTVTDGIVSSTNRTITVVSSAVPESQDDSAPDQNGPFNFAPPDGSAPSTNRQGSISINVIQTDAAINPGNSGGALVNTQGEVVGVNVAIAGTGSGSGQGTSGNIGVGFSIPINVAQRIATELINNGQASHGQLGVRAQPQAAGSGSQSSARGSRGSSFSVGALLARVEDGSPAQSAGLRAGDVITRVGDLQITDPSALTAAIKQQPGGSTVSITYLRDGREQSTDVTLGSTTQ